MNEGSKHRTHATPGTADRGAKNDVGHDVFHDAGHDLGHDAGHPTRNKEFMLTLAKGLAVLNAFGRDRPAMTLSQVAQAVELSRATARRVLHTLLELGYVELNDRHFALSPRIMRLGFAYVLSQHWIDHATPLMRSLSEQFHESCSAAILEGTEIIYVARVPARRIMSASLTVGSRLPAFHSAIGRVQLGFLDDGELWRRLKAVRVTPLTPSTITDLKALYERIRDDHRQGFSIVDEELERGLRAIAVPIAGSDGQCVGAINLSTHSARTSRDALREAFLPALRTVAAQVSPLVL